MLADAEDDGVRQPDGGRDGHAGRTGPVDNVFQLTRRFMNALERPIGTSSGYNTVWHGYAPYNPAMLQQYLDLFRTAHNFCHTGDDKKTPAMRLGLAENSRSATMMCLWPGQVPPAPPVEPQTAGVDLLSRWDGENETVTARSAPACPGLLISTKGKYSHDN